MRAKLTESQVADIKKKLSTLRFAQDLDFEKLAAEYNVTSQNIRLIANGETWSQIPWGPEGAPGTNRRPTLTPEKRRYIENLIEKVPGVSVATLAERVGVNEVTVARYLAKNGSGNNRAIEKAKHDVAVADERLEAAKREYEAAKEASREANEKLNELLVGA